ncbi:2-haloacid dehalogenase [Gemmobacter aquatilis]|uniref:2-haloacid dehalogenase n=1 Tax=Gemmobacter aquatilis TaxID=933059 RepID=A0A1H8K0U2_9RHOB|nr:HAD family phosphatase [Gemmobacter aquatilis]SEN86405.1 2-haloacid dehalogenase [Gemmobacter aquatilis]
MTIEAVIFDIGNVLIEWNPERFYDWTLGRAEREAFFAEVDLHAMNDAVDAGAPFRETVYAWAERHPDWAAEIRMWHDNWIDLASPRIEGSIALLRALRLRGVPVFALTNFGIDSFAYAQTQYDFLTEFDQAFVSGHMGVIKPDPRIYEMVEADCGVAPGRLLFTDDRADNIAAAQARGWQTHRFEGWQGWARRLVAAELLTEKEAGL